MTANFSIIETLGKLGYKDTTKFNKVIRPQISRKK